MNGYLSEVFSSYQGEGGSVRGSCQGKRQIFIRFSGCNLAGSNKPCVWCDSPAAHVMRKSTCRVEKTPGSANFETYKNPVSKEALMDLVSALETPDIHSIAITGGEPLCQTDFLNNLLDDADHPVYLETNGTLPESAEKIAHHVDYSCVDIKDQTALPYRDWEKILLKEFETIEILKNRGSEVFAKVVVTSDTKVDNIKRYAEELKRLDVPLAIQPVTSAKGGFEIESNELFKLTEAASQYLSADDITLSIQAHKCFGLL